MGNIFVVGVCTAGKGALFVGIIFPSTTETTKITLSIWYRQQQENFTDANFSYLAPDRAQTLIIL